MFGSIIKTLYERFHETSEFQTNISMLTDDSPSERLGTIVVDLFYSKTYVPVGSFTLYTSIVKNESDPSKEVRLCYVESINLEKYLLIQDVITIMNKIQSATAGIIKRPMDVLFQFEKDLTRVGGYITGMSVTDVTYNETVGCFARRIDGPLLKVDVIAKDHSHRSYDIDIKSIDECSITVNNTFAGKFIGDILSMSLEEDVDETTGKAINVLVANYTRASNKIDTDILDVLIKYYNTNVAKWYSSFNIT